MGINIVAAIELIKEVKMFGLILTGVGTALAIADNLCDKEDETIRQVQAELKRNVFVAMTTAIEGDVKERTPNVPKRIVQETPWGPLEMEHRDVLWWNAEGLPAIEAGEGDAEDIASNIKRIKRYQ